MMAFDAMTEVGDDALMVLYSNGDIQAAQALAYRHTPRIVAQANRLLRDQAEAEDVAQDAMLRLWKIAPDWRQGEAKVSTWLYRIVANLCTDRLRKRRSIGLDSIAEPEDGAPSVEASMQADERLRALHMGLAQLPERQRIAVTLRHIDELSNPDIAAAMGITVEAVESLTARGKRALATILNSKKQELGLA
jgi:RNA polymerase sigma factor (sigma-70 family)